MTTRITRIAAATIAVALGSVGLVAGPAIAAGFTGGLAPNVIGGLLDMNGSGRIGGRDDSNGFYGRTDVIDGAIDCDAWDGPNDGVAGNHVIDTEDDCTLIGTDGTADGATIAVRDGVIVAVDGTPVPPGYGMPAIFDANDPTNENIAQADLGWWVDDGRVDANGNGQIDDGDCARGVVGAADDEGLGPPADGAAVLAASPACATVSAHPSAVNGLVDLDEDQLITASDTCTNSCFVGLNVEAGFVGVHPTQVHQREISIALKRRLVALGTLTVLDGTTGCADRALVRVQRKIDRKWTTIQSARTNASGRYRATLPNFPGRYRAVAPNWDLRNGDRCRNSISPVAIRT